MYDKDGDTKVLKSVDTEEHLYMSLCAGEPEIWANKLVGLIKRAFSYLHVETLLFLYKTLIGTILDYGNTIWFPTLRKDIRALKVNKTTPKSYNITLQEISKGHDPGF